MILLEGTILSQTDDNIQFALNKRNILSFGYGLISRANYSAPSFGVISNRGSFEFSDFGGVQSFKTIYDENLGDKYKIELYLRNTLYNARTSIAKLDITDLDYDSQTKKWSLSLSDSLEEWQEIEVPAIEYNPLKPNDSRIITASNYYNYLRDYVPEKFEMVRYSELPISLGVLLSNTKVEYSLLKRGNLWSQFNKLCNLCGFYVYSGKNGKTTCDYTLGS